MSRYVDLDKCPCLKCDKSCDDFLHPYCDDYSKWWKGQDFVPVKRGHWIGYGHDYGSDRIHAAITDYVDHGGDVMKIMPQKDYCSSCLAEFDWWDCMEFFNGKNKYCPVCGAKMDQKVDYVE